MREEYMATDAGPASNNSSSDAHPFFPFSIPNHATPP